MLCVIVGNSAFKSPDEFKVSLPLRTNYLYGKIKKTLPELYAFTVCLWLRSSASPGIGTPFSYAVPGQANEIVLIEWGNNPIELLINDKVRLDELFVVSITRTRPDPLAPLHWLLPSLWEQPLRWYCLLVCYPLADYKLLLWTKRWKQKLNGTDICVLRQSSLPWDVHTLVCCLKLQSALGFLGFFCCMKHKQYLKPHCCKTCEI